MEETYVTRFQSAGACEGALLWLESDSLANCWQSCDKAQWMLWLIGQMAGDTNWPTRKEVCVCLCDCISPILQYLPEGETKPTTAVATIRSWCAGTTSDVDFETYALTFDSDSAVIFADQDNKDSVPTRIWRAVQAAIRAVRATISDDRLTLTKASGIVGLFTAAVRADVSEGVLNLNSASAVVANLIRQSIPTIPSAS